MARILPILNLAKVGEEEETVNIKSYYHFVKKQEDEDTNKKRKKGEGRRHLGYSYYYKAKRSLCSLLKQL